MKSHIKDFCRPSSRSLFIHVLSSLHLLYLSLNNVSDLGRKEFQCLVVLVFSVLYLPLRSVCLQSYSLCSECVGSFMTSNILLAARCWYKVSLLFRTTPRYQKVSTRSTSFSLVNIPSGLFSSLLKSITIVYLFFIVKILIIYNKSY